MERFEKNFNGIDAETARPFSAGYPDGVWVIGILYVMSAAMLAVLVVSGLLKVATEPLLAVPNIIVCCLSFTLSVLGLRALKNRSSQIVLISAILLGINVITVAILGVIKSSMVIPLIGACILNAYILYYVYGLERDKLIS